MAPCSPELQTGSGTARASCGDPLRACASPRCPVEWGQGGQRGKAGCRAPGRCPWAGPTGPSAPRSFSLAAWCEDLHFFFCGHSIAETSKAQVWAQSGRIRGTSQGWANTSELRAEAWGRSGQKETAFFSICLSPKSSQVPAQRAQGVSRSQLFPSKASPYLRNVELGNGRALQSRNALG